MWPGLGGWHGWVALAAALSSLMLGCQDKQPPPRKGELGAACQRAEDCGSGICVTLTGAPGAVCSLACDADGDCPALNWACTSTPGAARKACACTTTGASEVCSDGLDNDCDARTDCQACESNDDAGALECGGVCVDARADSNNCGGCGVACSFGRTCVDGECACPSSGPGDFCPGVGCVDLLVSDLDCGTCGTACELGQSCVDGQCQCPAETTLCGQACVDTEADDANCGECGNVCGPGLTCIDAACVCPADRVVCGADCSDLASDAGHCGSCAKACRPGEACAAAECSCESDLYCGDVCVPVDDPQNCGACGSACASGQVCSEGSCICQGAALTACGTECASLPNDENHCGNCATECSSSEVCEAGQCVCPAGKAYCAVSDSCIALASDALNCGSCGHACDAGTICVDSECVCPASNQLYCEAQGSCVDVLSSSAHCGDCKTVCPSPFSCVQGECACAAGETFCKEANACADLSDDDANCGGCGNACPSGAHCAGGKCACDSAGETLCGDACRDLTSDPLACGSCEQACEGSSTCVASACRCPQPTLGTPVLVANAVQNTGLRLAWDGKHVGLAYYRFVMIQDQNIHFVLLNPDGSVVPSSDRIVAPYSADYDLVWSGSEYAIAFDKQWSILFQRLDATGKSKAAEQKLDVGRSVDHLRLAWSSGNGYFLAYANTFSDGDSTISNWTIPLGVDGTTVGTPGWWGFGGKPGASNFLAGGDGTLGILLTNNHGSFFLSMDSSGQTRLPVALLTTGYALQTGAVGYDSAGYFQVWPMFHAIYLNRGVQLNQPLVVVDMAGSILLRPSIAQGERSVALGWTWKPTSAPTSDPWSFRFQRFRLPDAQTGAMQALTDPVDLTRESESMTRIVSTGPNSVLAVWTTKERDLYAMPIDFNACP